MLNLYNLHSVVIMHSFMYEFVCFLPYGMFHWLTHRIEYIQMSPSKPQPMKYFPSKMFVMPFFVYNKRKSWAVASTHEQTLEVLLSCIWVTLQAQRQRTHLLHLQTHIDRGNSERKFPSIFYIVKPSNTFLKMKREVISISEKTRKCSTMVAPRAFCTAT